MRRPTFAKGALAFALVAGVAVVGVAATGGSEGPAEARAQAASDTASRDTLSQEDLGQGGVSATTAAGGDTLTPAEQAIQDHYRASRGPQQPFPFSHRWHAGDLGMACEYCHTDGRRAEAVTIPPVSLCMGCHQWVGRNLPPIGSLRTAWEQNETIPWERVYKLPEFVQFSHQPHLRNQIDCQECHGPVEEMDRIYRFSSLTMGWCLSCHRGERQPTDVATTYQLVRDADIPETPAGRQPVGLYPRSIPVSYGATRAPDDCATCHY